LVQKFMTIAGTTSLLVTSIFPTLSGEKTFFNIQYTSLIKFSVKMIGTVISGFRRFLGGIRDFPAILRYRLPKRPFPPLFSGNARIAQG